MVFWGKKCSFIILEPYGLFQVLKQLDVIIRYSNETNLCIFHFEVYLRLYVEAHVKTQHMTTMKNNGS